MLKFADTDNMNDSNLMTEWAVVQKSLAYLACSSIMPPFFLMDFKTAKIERRLVEHRPFFAWKGANGSISAQPRYLTIASTNLKVCVFYFS
jgi:hypothetical protein